MLPRSWKLKLNRNLERTPLLLALTSRYLPAWDQGIYSVLASEGKEVEVYPGPSDNFEIKLILAHFLAVVFFLSVFSPSTVANRSIIIYLLPPPATTFTNTITHRCVDVLMLFTT